MFPIIFGLFFFVFAIWIAINMAGATRPGESDRDRAIRRCMRFAASKGYDPYNSHTVQARCFRLQAGRVK